MRIKKRLKQVPIVLRTSRKLTARSNSRNLAVLKDSPSPQGFVISAVLESLQDELHPTDREWIVRIETARQWLAERTDPLNDGSFPNRGIYDEGITIAEACLSSIPPQTALFIYQLTRELNPHKVIELGTNVGISSAYIGAAMIIRGQNGLLSTLELSPYRQRQARQIHQDLGIENIIYVDGRFVDSLTPALTSLGSVDLAFIDGHHQYQPTIDYFERILEFSSPDTVFIFDDIRWSAGMKKAWAQIQSDPRLGLTVDLTSIGICVQGQGKKPRHSQVGPIKVF